MHRHTSRTHGHLLPNHNNTRNNQEALILLANKFPSVPPTRKNPLKANLKAAFRIDFRRLPIRWSTLISTKTLQLSGCLCQITTHLLATATFSSFVLFLLYFIFVSQISSHPKNIFFIFYFRELFVAHSRRRSRQSRLDRHNSKWRRRHAADQDHFVAKFRAWHTWISRAGSQNIPHDECDDDDACFDSSEYHEKSTKHLDNSDENSWQLLLRRRRRRDAFLRISAKDWVREREDW